MSAARVVGYIVEGARMGDDLPQPGREGAIKWTLFSRRACGRREA